MLADPVVASPSYIDEFEQWGRQSNEATQRHFDAIRREEEIEALQQQSQQDDTFYSPIRTKYDRTKHNKQPERSSANGIGQHLTGKYSTSYHTPPAPLHNGSKTGYHKPSGNADQSPK
jgi:hypothetical protein